jgi:hypothetical protein
LAWAAQLAAILFIFFGAVIGLGYLGAREPTGGYVIAAPILTIYYFAFFFMILPLLGLFEKTKSVPNSISESVLAWRFGWCVGVAAPGRVTITECSREAAPRSSLSVLQYASEFC